MTAHSADFSPSHYRISAELSLNPTRSFNHYSRDQAVALADDQIDFPAPPIFSTRDAYTCGYEWSLNNNDNVIVHPAHARKANEANWPRFRCLHLRAADNFIGALLNEAQQFTGLEGQSVERVPSYQLRYLETYWEFQHPDPIRLTHQLQPRLRALGQFVRETEYLEDVRVVTTQHINAVSYRIELAQGIELAVYAKTNKRIRLEIRHRTTSLSSGVGGLPTSFEVHSVEALDELIERLSIHAQDRLNRVIDILTADIENRVDNASTYELVRELIDACDWAVEHSNWTGPSHRDNREAAYNVIASSLINRNSYRVSSGDP